ncbi:uncharacterized protein [Periplaneta americana]|uniref:uncharacterized protein isoform X2 n=1 Tax=Periplaneta americana TaxID=6978 RepID=UPI0037E9C6E0
MESSGIICWILLAVAAVCLSSDNNQKNGFFRRVIYSPISMDLSRQKRQTKSPTNVDVGDIHVQSGSNWSVDVFGFLKIKRKPGGGVDVSVNLPQGVFSRNGSGAPPGQPGQNPYGQEKSGRIPRLNRDNLQYE